MVTIRKCAFCGEGIEPGTGKMIVDASGSVSFYCSSKCQKNVELKRSYRKVKWTTQYRKEKAIRVQHLKDTAAKEKPGAKAEKKAVRGSQSEPARELATGQAAHRVKKTLMHRDQKVPREEKKVEEKKAEGKKQKPKKK